MLGFVFLMFLILVMYYRTNYIRLTKYANDTEMVHFKPSYKDLILGLYSQGFTVFILIMIILFFPEVLNNPNRASIIIEIIALSAIIQIFTAVITNHSKIKLIETAVEPLDNAIIEKLRSKTKDINNIKKFVFADIKPASLFLSAGVTDYGLKSKVCLVSRYFQWKLSEDELLTVLGHEIGHTAHHDMFQTKLLIAFQGIMRTLLFYFLIILMQSLFNGINSNTVLLLQLIILILVLVTQMLISFSLQLRMFNQEIMADEYGASLMGNYNMAYTLKKLPKVIPAPVDDHPLNFLGFRIAVLNLHAKMNNEVDNSPKKEFSRFSNN